MVECKRLKEGDVIFRPGVGSTIRRFEVQYIIKGRKRIGLIEIKGSVKKHTEEYFSGIENFDHFYTRVECIEHILDHNKNTVLEIVKHSKELRNRVLEIEKQSKKLRKIKEYIRAKVLGNMMHRIVEVTDSSEYLDRKVFDKIMGELVIFFDVEDLTKRRLDSYYEELKKYTEEKFRLAYVGILRYETKFPTPIHFGIHSAGMKNFFLV